MWHTVERVISCRFQNSLDIENRMFLAGEILKKPLKIGLKSLNVQKPQNSYFFDKKRKNHQICMKFSPVKHQIATNRIYYITKNSSLGFFDAAKKFGSIRALGPLQKFH
jgi:hypothetical protein